MKINTDYGMRMPGNAEIARVFGSLQRAVDITGGDLPTLLLYLHNPDRIDAAPPVALQPGEFANALRVAANTERRDAERQAEEQAAAAAFSALEKPTVTAVADRIGVCPATARKRLIAAGKWPREVRDARPT